MDRYESIVESIVFEETEWLQQAQFVGACHGFGDPNEVEGVVMMHPGVLECAAVGVADQHSSETVKLFVVRKDPDLTEKDVREHCHQLVRETRRRVGVAHQVWPARIEARDLRRAALLRNVCAVVDGERRAAGEAAAQIRLPFPLLSQ